MMSYVVVAAVLLVGVIVSIVTNKLTLGGAITGGVIGFSVFLGAGYTGLIMLAAFFILGTGATSHKKAVKVKLKIAQPNRGRRTVGQVFANGGVAALLGLYAWFYPSILIQIMIAASLASATADTLSSELGSVYGKRFYNIISLKRDQRGLDGVISLEGTFIGGLGSAIIAAIFCMHYEWSNVFLWITIAGTIGNICDSILGATLERKGDISNDIVNFLNTFIAAFIIYIYMLLMR